LSVWSLWSVFVLFLGDDYGFTPEQKFLVTTVPTVVGAFLRLPYRFAVAKFGGRNWTIFSSLVLLIPCVLAGLVLEPGVEFNTLLIIAAVAGVGGGNFSSSMANIDSYYPHRLKGWASASTPAAATSAWPRSSSSAWPCSPPRAKTAPG
jgi:NNP family nitrate/nitrite transporter-like MFS transporter